MSTHALESSSLGRAWGCRLPVVLRQDADTRAYRWLGVLSRHDGEFHFRYTDEAASDADLQTLPDSLIPTRQYASPNLFATFANRVMTPRRDCYQSFLDMIGLSGEDIDPFEVLARTWGTRVTDRIQVLPVPKVDAVGACACVSSCTVEDTSTPTQRSSGTVSAGDRLTLVREPGNPEDAPWRSLLLCRWVIACCEVRAGSPMAPFVHAPVGTRDRPWVMAETVTMPDAPLASNQMRLPRGWRRRWVRTSTSWLP